RCAEQFESGVERPLAGDIRADPRPIGRQRARSVISGPTLQVLSWVGEWRAGRNDRLGRREPQEISRAAEIDLGTEEYVISRCQREGVLKWTLNCTSAPV